LNSDRRIVGGMCAGCVVQSGDVIQKGFIGAAITLQQQNGDIPKMWVYVVVSSALGVILNLALISLERRVLKWHSAHRSVVAA